MGRPFLPMLVVTMVLLSGHRSCRVHPGRRVFGSIMHIFKKPGLPSWAMVHIVRRVGVSILLVSASLLAGCVAEDDKKDTATEQPAVITDPTDYGYLDDETSTQVAHIHDYWGGQTQMQIMDKTEYKGGTWFGDRLEDFVEMRPDDGDIVPQGTGRVDVTVTWKDGVTAMYDQIELYVKTGNMTGTDRLLGVLEQGKTITFDITNDDADLPHQVLSSWIYGFTFTRGETQPRIELDTELTITMVAYRTLGLPVFPAHPDHWHNETALPILFDRHSSAWAAHGYGANYCLTANETGQPSCFRTHVPSLGAIVPRDAHHVKVVVEQENGLDSYVTLAYHGADQREYKEATDGTVEGKVTTYILRTGGSETDGPYSKQSLWEFQMWTHGPDGDGGVYRGKYSIIVTVHQGPE